MLRNAASAVVRKLTSSLPCPRHPRWATPLAGLILLGTITAAPAALFLLGAIDRAPGALFASAAAQPAPGVTLQAGPPAPAIAAVTGNTPFVVATGADWQWSGQNAVEVTAPIWATVPGASSIWSPSCAGAQVATFTKGFELPADVKIANSYVRLTADDFVDSLLINGNSVELPHDLKFILGNWNKTYTVSVPTGVFGTHNIISVTARNSGLAGIGCSGNPAGVALKLSIEPQPELPLRYLAMNVGNASLGTGCWEAKLCREEDVQSLRHYIDTWQPDIILLSEVLRKQQLVGTAGPLEATIIRLDSSRTYLHTDSTDTGRDAIPIDLKSLGLASGDVIRLRIVGDFQACPHDFHCGPETHSVSAAVFSSSPLLSDRNLPHRVPGAIDAGADVFSGSTFFEREPTDIPEDFSLSSSFDVLVEIPVGATHLFIAPIDSYWGDNHEDDGGNYGVSIQAAGGGILPNGYTGMCGESRDRDTGALVSWDAPNASHEHECVAWKTSRLSYVPGSARSVYGSCEYHYTGFRVNLLLEGKETITAVTVHPDPNPLNETCRTEEIRRYWQELADADGSTKVIIGGDWNTASDQAMQRPHRFKVNYSRGMHWDIIEHADEQSAIYGGIGRQIDHAYSSFGRPCTVCGEAYGTPSLIYGSALGGYDDHPRADGGDGMDHRQILVDLDAGLTAFNVSLTKPASGAVFGPNPVIGFEAEVANAPAEVARVDFYADDGSGPRFISSVSSAPFRVGGWIGTAIGNYTLSAMAFDNAGNTTVSAPVVITTTDKAFADLEVRDIHFSSPPRPGEPTTAIAYLVNNGEVNSGVFNVLWYLDGILVGAGSHASLAPGEVSEGNVRFAWTPTPGEHTLRFEADAHGYVVETDEGNNSAAVNVTPVNERPRVSITNPMDGQEFNPFPRITVMAEAFDPDGEIARVEFRVGRHAPFAQPIGSQDHPPYAISWQNAPTGSHTIWAIAWDTLGASETSAPVTITVRSPAGSIIYPRDGDVFPPYSNIGIRVGRSGSPRLRRVEFYANGLLLGADSGPLFNFHWARVAPGAYSLTVRVYDMNGGVTDSLPVNITVLEK